ncbi:UvrD-helicase domain-containing protein [Piscinibacter sp.]|uniref:UvrD-helicase domain-containing protein n=1 Tax=Piscinibacter sp. TaxID=1903157 RepID=UPI0039E66776
MSNDTAFQPKDISPTDEQLAIQLSRESFVIVEANAGAAKTTTLALRLAQAIARGAAPNNLLALTYTEPACEALNRALRRIGVPSAARSKLRVRTFEAFCQFALSKLEGSAVPRYEVAEKLKPFVMRSIERVLGNADERYPNELVIPGAGDAVVEQYLDDFLHLKGTLQLDMETADRTITPAVAADLGREYAMLKVFRAYERERRGGHPDRHRFRGEGDATYDLAHRLLHDDASLGDSHALATGLRLIVVDEMHDMNRAMFTVLQHLLQANPRCAFVGVGDRNQVIHARAGADARFMGEVFQQEIGPTRSYPLTASFRFGPALARPAGRVSSKKYSSQSDRKTKVQLYRCKDAAESDQAIVDAAVARVGLDRKTPLSEFAVLLRHPHQSIGIENRLLAANVAYTTEGFESYLVRPEILLVRGLLAYAADDFSAIGDRDTRERVLRALLLFAGATIDAKGPERAPSGWDEQMALEKEASTAIADDPRLLRVFFENQVQRMGAPEACKRMLTGVEAARSHTGRDALKKVIDALDLQYLASKALVRVARVREVTGNIAGLLASAGSHETAHDYFLALNTFELRQRNLKAKESIVLSSIEAAKGLEFEHVLMPNINAREFAVSGDSTDDRNLFYVAITRAKNQLSLYCEASRPSGYLRDAGLIPSA